MSFVRFLGENKVWWILPLAIALVVLGWVIFGEQAPSDPFHYGDF